MQYFSRIVIAVALIFVGVFTHACEEASNPVTSTADTRPSGKADDSSTDALMNTDTTDGTPDTATHDTVIMSDPCEAIRAANICRRWLAYDYNGHETYGEIFVTCEPSTDVDHPNTCEVSQQNDEVFVVQEFTLYGTHDPTEDDPLEGQLVGDFGEVYLLLMWKEEAPEYDVLHIFVEFSSGSNDFLLSR